MTIFWASAHGLCESTYESDPCWKDFTQSFCSLNFEDALIALELMLWLWCIVYNKYQKQAHLFYFIRCIGSILILFCEEKFSFWLQHQWMLKKRNFLLEKPLSNIKTLLSWVFSPYNFSKYCLIFYVSFIFGNSKILHMWGKETIIFHNSLSLFIWKWTYRKKCSLTSLKNFRIKNLEGQREHLKWGHSWYQFG